ncbi:MAG: GHMP kinase [Blastocatellia bacterium]|nr:GHMP kinase [Blastocatellia bacterium]
MYEIVQGTTHGLSDAADFIETLNALAQDQRPEACSLFDTESEIIVARAPGRLDVMGGIADYSGSLVLEMPIREATFVALQRNPSRNLKIVSLSEETGRETSFEMSLDDFENAGYTVDYGTARSRFQLDSARAWAAYVAGVFLVLMRERGVFFQDGARILIASRVPEGKGVSSSAALEVAVMQSVAAAYHITVAPREMALLCQMVENLVVGAPCGIMDQMTASLGEASRLLALLCQPAELREPVSIPDDIAFWGLDSGVRHSVAGADYTSVRVGAFMGYRIISDLAGLETRHIARGGPFCIDDPRWRGYLANLAPSEFEQAYASHLPERIGGAEFLSRYQSTTDPVTQIRPEGIYDVRVPTSHPVYEHHRARLFAELLAGAGSEQRLELLGELMYQSHASYSACGLGSEGTDRLVELVREAGPKLRLYGARITGGGSGGTVAVLGRSDAGASIADVADRYAEETGYRPYIFSGSSPGSAAFGYIKLKNS